MRNAIIAINYKIKLKTKNCADAGYTLNTKNLNEISKSSIFN